MSRCCICDFSFDTTSLYNEAGFTPPNLSRHIELVEWRGDIYCTDCLNSIDDALSEFEIEEEEEDTCEPFKYNPLISQSD